MRPSRAHPTPPALAAMLALIIPILATPLPSTQSKLYLVCKEPNSQDCTAWPVDDHGTFLLRAYQNTQRCGLSNVGSISLHRKYFKVRNSNGSGSILCQINKISYKNVLEVSSMNLNAEKLNRIPRAAAFATRGRYRGQTQSQYLAINSGDKNGGKAEAHSEADSSRASVSGSSGMGQAQSQSTFDPGCDDCYGRSDAESLKRKTFIPSKDTSQISAYTNPSLGTGLPGTMGLENHVGLLPSQTANVIPSQGTIPGISSPYNTHDGNVPLNPNFGSNPGGNNDPNQSGTRGNTGFYPQGTPVTVNAAIPIQAKIPNGKTNLYPTQDTLANGNVGSFPNQGGYLGGVSSPIQNGSPDSNVGMYSGQVGPTYLTPVSSQGGNKGTNAGVQSSGTPSGISYGTQNAIRNRNPNVQAYPDGTLNNNYPNQGAILGGIGTPGNTQNSNGNGSPYSRPGFYPNQGGIPGISTYPNSGGSPERHDNTYPTYGTDGKPIASIPIQGRDVGFLYERGVPNQNGEIGTGSQQANWPIRPGYNQGADGLTYYCCAVGPNQQSGQPQIGFRPQQVETNLKTPGGQQTGTSLQSPGSQIPVGFGIGSSYGPGQQSGQIASGPSLSGPYGPGQKGGTTQPVEQTGSGLFTGGQYVPGQQNGIITTGGQYGPTQQTGTAQSGGQYTPGQQGGIIQPVGQLGPTQQARATQPEGQIAPGQQGGIIQYGPKQQAGTTQPGGQFTPGQQGGIMQPGGKYGGGQQAGTTQPSGQFTPGQQGGVMQSGGQYGPVQQAGTIQPGGQFTPGLQGGILQPGGQYGPGQQGGATQPSGQFAPGQERGAMQPGGQYGPGQHAGITQPGVQYAPGQQGVIMQPGGQYGPGQQAGTTQPGGQFTPGLQGGIMQPGGQYGPGKQAGTTQPGGQYAPGQQGVIFQPGGQYGPGQQGETTQPGGQVAPSQQGGVMQPGGQYGPGQQAGTIQPGGQYALGQQGGIMQPGGQYGPGQQGGTTQPGGQYAPGQQGGVMQPNGQYGPGLQAETTHPGGQYAPGQGGIMQPGGQYGPGQQGGTTQPGGQYAPGQQGGVMQPSGQYGPGQQTGTTQPGGTFNPSQQGGITQPVGQYGPGQQGGTIQPGGQISSGTSPSGHYGTGQQGGSNYQPGGLISTGQYGPGQVGGTNLEPTGYIQGGSNVQPGGQINTGKLPTGQYGQGGTNVQPGDLTGNGAPIYGLGGIPQNVLDPNSIAATIDDYDSNAEASVAQNANGTVASASSRGGNDKGRAQTNVQGTYTGSGSFSAQAEISDENKSAHSEVEGGKKGAKSSAQGSGRKNLSQASVQLGSETGSLQTAAETKGSFHSSNSKVQGSVKGGMADAQAKGPGSTSSQAQIGFTPYKEGDAAHEKLKTPFIGKGSASAQSSGRSGQSQSSLGGTFKYGISYSGAAQSGASLDRDTVFPNRVPYNNIDVYDEKDKNINVDTQEPPEFSGATEKNNFNDESGAYTNNSESENSHSHIDHHKSDGKTQPPDNGVSVGTRRSFQPSYTNGGEYEYGNGKEDATADDYYPDGGIGPDGTDNAEIDQNEYSDEYSKDSDTTHQSLQTQRKQGLEVKQNSGGNTQHIILGSLGNQDAEITQRNSERPDENRIYQPGEQVPGTGGYTIPIGFTGSVKSVSSKDKTYVVGSKDSPSQAQTVALSPGSGKVRYVYPPAYGRNVKPKDLRSLYQPAPDDGNRYVSVSKSVTKDLDGEDNIRKQYSHTYYTKSSSCGYFTFTCTMVSGADGQKKVCKPKIPTNPDGTPMKC